MQVNLISENLVGFQNLFGFFSVSILQQICRWLLRMLKPASDIYTTCKIQALCGIMLLDSFLFLSRWFVFKHICLQKGVGEDETNDGRQCPHDAQPTSSQLHGFMKLMDTEIFMKKTPVYSQETPIQLLHTWVIVPSNQAFLSGPITHPKCDENPWRRTKSKLHCTPRRGKMALAQPGGGFGPWFHASNGETKLFNGNTREDDKYLDIGIIIQYTCCHMWMINNLSDGIQRLALNS